MLKNTLTAIFYRFLMSFSFTSAEELREVAEREAVQMAEKEEAWEEQKIALKASGAVSLSPVSIC